MSKSNDAAVRVYHAARRAAVLAAIRRAAKLAEGACIAVRGAALAADDARRAAIYAAKLAARVDAELAARTVTIDACGQEK